MRADRALLVLLLVPLAGCATLMDVLRGGVVTPTARYESASLENVSLEDATVKAIFTIDNPNPVGVSLEGLDWSFALDSQQLLNGRIPTGLRIPPNGSAQIQVPVTVPFKAIPGLATTFANKKEAPYSVQASAKVRTPIGILSVPMRWDGVLPIPKLPKVSLASAQVDNVSLAGARILLRLNVDNPNTFRLPLDELGGRVSIAGQPVAKLAMSAGKPLAAGKVTLVELPLEVSFLSAGRAVSTALTTGGARLELDGEARVGGKTLPLDLATTLTR